MKLSRSRESELRIDKINDARRLRAKSKEGRLRAKLKEGRRMKPYIVKRPYRLNFVYERVSGALLGWVYRDREGWWFNNIRCPIPAVCEEPYCTLNDAAHTLWLCATDPLAGEPLEGGDCPRCAYDG